MRLRKTLWLVLLLAALPLVANEAQDKLFKAQAAAQKAKLNAELGKAVMKSVTISIDANANQRYVVAEVGGQTLYVGNDFSKVIEAVQMVNADASAREDFKHRFDGN